nr:unnamed protein product [Callosobruchus chinensis]
MRPFAPLQTVKSIGLLGPKEKELIHIILPLSGRTATFQSFMTSLSKLGSRMTEGAPNSGLLRRRRAFKARAIMSRVMTKNSGKREQPPAASPERDFLQRKGLTRWSREDLGVGRERTCCVYVRRGRVFSARFLDRCRWNTRPARRSTIRLCSVCTNPHVVTRCKARRCLPRTISW